MTKKQKIIAAGIAVMLALIAGCVATKVSVKANQNGFEMTADSIQINSSTKSLQK